MDYNSVIFINGQEISISSPTYFIADLASNHDGDLEKAKHLIWLAKDAGADAVKFQHFLAEKIVSDYGFSHMKASSHQAGWKKSVYEVFKEYECRREWNEELYRTAKEAKIHFLTTPYDTDAVEGIDPYVPAYKIGSGDITWTDFIRFIASKRKPVFLATGASSMTDVERAVSVVLRMNPDIVLMQCNTNYTGNLENFHYVNLNVLRTYAVRYPGMILGLSDHTPGHAAVLGAIALGARVVEKHFTSDNNLVGPDHAFSLNPSTWREMIDRSRELEAALGTGIKRVEENERETVIVQRRCLRLNKALPQGSTLTEHDVESLRPAPEDAFPPFELSKVLGRRIKVAMPKGAALHRTDLEDEKD